MEDKAKKLSFLYDLFGNKVGGRFLQFWIDDEDFQNAILDAMEKRENIDERLLLSIMSEIYARKKAAIDRGGED